MYFYVGEYLASAGDGEDMCYSYRIAYLYCTDNMLILWSKTEENNLGESNLVSDTPNKENWNVVKVLRGHLEDIYDLCWSCDSCYIITGSVDNSAIAWDVLKG